MFLYTSNYHLEIEMREAVPFIRVIKSIKFLEITLKGQLQSYLKKRKL